jgi:hypothetical protein
VFLNRILDEPRQRLEFKSVFKPYSDGYKEYLLKPMPGIYVWVVNYNPRIYTRSIGATRWLRTLWVPEEDTRLLLAATHNLKGKSGLVRSRLRTYDRAELEIRDPFSLGHCQRTRQLRLSPMYRHACWLRCIDNDIQVDMSLSQDVPA